MKKIESKKYTKKFAEYNPYSVDFTAEEAKARGMTKQKLFGALSDAIEATQISANEGKYFDQVSVYRRELERREVSINEQDKIIQNIPSLHTVPQSSAKKELHRRRRMDAVEKTRGAWGDLNPEQSQEISESNRWDFNR